MEHFARNKVRGGKLLCVRLNSEGGKLTSIRVSGDFFAYPESVIGRIEKALLGSDLSGRAQMRERINRAISEDDAELIGVDADSLLETIEMAVENGVASNTP